LKARRALQVAALLALACRGEPRGPCQPSPAPGELGTICGFENPEDVEPAAGPPRRLWPDGESVATGARSVGIRPLSPAGTPHDIGVAGHPDNLAAGPGATVYAAVHSSGLAVLLCRFGARPCRSPWLLMEIDPASHAAALRLEYDGSRVGSVASVARVGGRMYFGAVFDDRIGTLRVSADPAARGGAI
jgi:hypothetical protein